MKKFYICLTFDTDPDIVLSSKDIDSKDKKIVKTFASYSINKDDKEITFADTNVLPRATIKSMRRIYEKLK